MSGGQTSASSQPYAGHVGGAATFAPTYPTRAGACRSSTPACAPATSLPGADGPAYLTYASVLTLTGTTSHSAQVSD